MMEWYVVIAVVLGPLLFLMVLCLPVAFSFLAVNLVGGYLLMGGLPGVEQLVLNTVDSLASFTLVPIALFMIMGEAMFQSRIAIDLMDTLDKWFGRLRGRLAYMAVGGGVLFSTLTGNSMGSIALLGSTLVPEMEKRGYKKPMSLGPILGSAGLAIETGSTSPPLGAALFVMKAVAPKGTTMNDIYKAAMPFILCDILAILLIFYIPEIVTWPVEMMVGPGR